MTMFNRLIAFALSAALGLVAGLAGGPVTGLVAGALGFLALWLRGA